MNKETQPRKRCKSRSQSRNSLASKSWRCLLEKDLIAYKAFCFFLYGAYGSLLPYLPLYFKQLGIHAFEAGVIIGVRPMVQIIAAPFYGALADRYRAGKILLLGGVLGWVIKALMLLAVRPHNQQCISVYYNKTTNITSAYIYAKPLWGQGVDNRKKWTLVPLKTGVLVEQEKLALINLGHKENPKGPQHIKQKDKVIYQVRKRKLNKNIAFNLDGKYKDLPATFAENIWEKRLLSWENSTMQLNASSQQDNKSNYAKSIIIKSSAADLKNSSKATKTRRNQNPKETSSRQRYSLHIETLENIGKAIRKIVKVFDARLNTTVTYVTQIDIPEMNFMFIIFTLFIILGEFLESPTYTLSDTSLLDRLGEDREYYGNIRMYGSLGWAFAGLSVGYLVTATEFDLCKVTSGNYLVAFYVFIGCCVVAFFSVFGFTFKYDQKKSSGPSFREVVQVLLNLRFSSFLLSALFVGWCYGFLIHFVNWFIDDLEGSSLVMGVAGAARELTGLAFFFIGGSVIGVLGHVNTIILCLFSYLGLFYSYSNVTSPWVVVPLEMLAGASYALAWSTCVNYTNLVGASLGVSATVQGLLQSVFWGLGNGGGSVISGGLYHEYGPVVTFQIFAVASGITALFLFAMTKIAGAYDTIDLTEEDYVDYQPVESKSLE